MTQDPPFLNNVFNWPADTMMSYITTSDGIQLRTCKWVANKPSGTIFILPGRADYIEKYGGFADVCLTKNMNVLAVDWRGQGLSDRLLNDRNIGHIENFKDYQKDVEVLIDEAKASNFVKPWIISAHSMGGLIGLRSLHETNVFDKVVFISPMWGIEMPPILKSGAPIIMSLISLIGKMETYAPTTSSETRVIHEEFEINKLTSDMQNFKLLRQQVITYPDLQIGGPSSAWVNAALDEIEVQMKNRPPSIPALCLIGEEEEIVETSAVKNFCNDWETCNLILIPKARHDLLMERQTILADLFVELEKFILN
jgi:lysophospholipase